MLDKCENGENSEQMIIWLQFLSEIYQKLGLFKECLSNLEKCIEIYEYQLQYTQNQIEQSKLLFNQSLFFEQFADIYSDLRNYEQSIIYLNYSRQYWANQDPEILNFNHQRIISNLGEIYALTGNIDKSVQFLNLVKQKIELQQFDQYNTQIYLKNCLLLGKIEANQGNYKDSEEITLNCYKISQNKQDKKMDYKLKVEIIEHLATTYNFLQNMEQFDKYIEIGFQVLKEAGIQNKPINIRFFQLQGFLQFRQGKYQQAIESGTNLKKIAENKFGQNCYQAVDGYMIIGLSQFAQGFYEKNQLKKEEGLNNLELSVKISEQNCEKQIEILSDLAKCYLKNKQFKQSIDSAEKIQKIKHDNLVEQNFDLKQLESQKILIDSEFKEFKTEVEKQEKINKSLWGFLF
ncbi:hypothetical protein PPERSA_03927 [Pseudocohnilembus persalinus]|uniref:Tetratricopeptide repeat protein n=1 Tax=Pseudocohnilembus persalinus TaxID=266149 RepID=A0A0V0R5W3_PSEPJ|nr:hypothetical protein PPERSA_03927 [Pseudocohnilembus persalinus]|eukprot:KRX09865.1 hypothetical protein PPERSA_03927 [Pseudocohnilembus persalinus]